MSNSNSIYENIAISSLLRVGIYGLSQGLLASSGDLMQNIRIGATAGVGYVVGRIAVVYLGKRVFSMYGSDSSNNQVNVKFNLIKCIAYGILCIPAIIVSWQFLNFFDNSLSLKKIVKLTGVTYGSAILLDVLIRKIFKIFYTQMNICAIIDPPPQPLG